MNRIQDRTDKKKIRIDLDTEQSMNLELEEGSGIWHVVVKHDEADEKVNRSVIDLHGDKRAVKRELDLRQFQID
ncbi:hypothetical protein Pla110_04000 [Polystyrenella longa]|uniref:Uncharacterized protein n=1 Tax=Polystyrenella longa TaxID=2528007 RepID=A0A518CHI8_9PLAN|nr:hypothetical protein [Polystyrenella longa]QDU78696.1 hypothetical protein Pla110_04000 [Polystyrenella longa]